MRVGNTSLLRLVGVEKAYALSAALYAKAEYTNEGGSIKDRVAQTILDDAEKDGKIQNGGTVVEATSGNTGIGLALAARLRGYKAVIVMPNTMSIERQEVLKNYGAQVVLTDGALGMQGAVERAREIVRTTPNAFLADQFENVSGVKAHYQTTAPEICQDLEKVDVFVTGVGTGGTLTGVGRFLKEKNPAVHIVAVEPKQSPLLSLGRAGAHAIQGIGANFLPRILDLSVIDEVLTVDDLQSVQTAKALQKIENLSVGISSGANVLAALELAKRKEYAGKNIVTIFPDGGGRYASIYEKI